MNIDRKSTIIKIFYFTLILILTLTQMGLAPFPQGEIPPIVWEIDEVTGGKDWEALKPNGEFNAEKFCRQSDNTSDVNIYNCFGDQFYAFLIVKGKVEAFSLAIFLIDGNRYLVREIDGKFYITCFSGLEPGENSSVMAGEILLPPGEEKNLITAVQEYDKKLVELKKEMTDMNAWISAAGAGAIFGCFVGGIVGAGAFSLPGCLAGFVLGGLGGIVVGLIERVSHLDTINRDLDKYRNILPT
jgi:hypothetical protein